MKHADKVKMMNRECEDLAARIQHEREDQRIAYKASDLVIVTLKKKLDRARADLQSIIRIGAGA